MNKQAVVDAFLTFSQEDIHALLKVWQMRNSEIPVTEHAFSSFVQKPRELVQACIAQGVGKGRKMGRLTSTILDFVGKNPGCSRESVAKHASKVEEDQVLVMRRVYHLTTTGKIRAKEKLLYV